PEEELSRGVRLPRSRGERAASATRRSRLEVQGGTYHSGASPGRSRGADHRLAAGGVRLFHRARRHRQEARQEAEVAEGAHKTGLMSTTGVPSIASIGPTRSRFRSIARTTTR